MTRGIITISESSMVCMPTEEVWMTLDEIADMFGVFDSLVHKTIRTIYIRTIYKGKELGELETSKCIPSGKGYCVDVYNLDVVIILAYRISTVQCRALRKFQRERLRATKSGQPMYVVLNPNQPTGCGWC